MNATHIIDRQARQPDPIQFWTRMYERQMERVIQPRLDPMVMLERPLGVARGIHDTDTIVDYTMSHYGGSLRGAKIGQWKHSLLIGAHMKQIAQPTLFSWRGSQIIEKPGEPQWELDDSPPEEI